MGYYNDERLTEVEAKRDETLAEVSQVYDGMINQSDKFYQAQVDATKQWEEKQTQLQQDRTDFAIEQIEQQKEQAQKDYTKEQSASYVDWQKQSNQYGANAEAMASSGLTNTGYSESSQVSMYNTYQNRVATARDVYNRAVLNYNNSIKDAQLQNNSILAEIAYNSLSQQLELSLSGFQYKNELVLGKLDTKLRVDESYHNRYMDILGQINTENALAEQIRQFDLSLAEDRRQYDTSLAEQVRQYNESLAEDRRQYNTTLAQKKTKSVSEEDDDEAFVKPREQKTTIDNNGAVNVANGMQVNTAYYQGALNPDVRKYGAFSNGYQPRGIEGHGNLNKTSETAEIETQTLSGELTKVKQSVWRASDGTFWYWDDRKNKYIQLKK